MIFKQYYLGCLSHASYLIGDQATGRAVVDPQRDNAAYLETPTPPVYGSVTLSSNRSRVSTSAAPVRSKAAPSAAHTTCNLPNLIDRLGQLDTTLPAVVYCAGGYRSSIAASTLRAHGFTDVSDLLGGYPAWANLHQTPNEQDSST